MHYASEESDENSLDKKGKKEEEAPVVTSPSMMKMSCNMIEVLRLRE